MCKSLQGHDYLNSSNFYESHESRLVQCQNISKINMPKYYETMTNCFLSFLSYFVWSYAKANFFQLKKSVLLKKSCDNKFANVQHASCIYFMSKISKNSDAMWILYMYKFRIKFRGPVTTRCYGNAMLRFFFISISSENSQEFWIWNLT